MRPTLIYGTVLLLSCFVIVIVRADRKWKYTSDPLDPNPGKSTTTTPPPKKTYDEEGEDNSSFQKARKPPSPPSPPPKRFIGRIEHGKVMVLRRNEDAATLDDDRGVCKKKSKTTDCRPHDDYSSEEDDAKSGKNQSKKQIKYSIKFAHEKQKKKDKNDNRGDVSIMRLHKNERRRYKSNGGNDDSSEEEDDKPIKRFHFVDDDD